MTPRSRTTRRAAQFQGADHLAAQCRERRAARPRIEREGIAVLYLVVVAFNGAAVGDGDRYVRSINARNEIGASEMDDRGDELRA